jgi:hypothetical protein
MQYCITDKNELTWKCNYTFWEQPYQYSYILKQPSVNELIYNLRNAITNLFAWEIYKLTYFVDLTINKQ